VVKYILEIANTFFTWLFILFILAAAISLVGEWFTGLILWYRNTKSLILSKLNITNFYCYEHRVYDYLKKEWYRNPDMKYLHREDGPAVEYSDGSKEWYLNGRRHREGESAVEFAYGLKKWYINGELHREGGPAVEYSSGKREWYFHGKRHREEGPAIECPDGRREWHLNGELNCIEYPDGKREWYLNRKIHRSEGPAIEYPNGDKAWFSRGVLHRDLGPAVEKKDGTKEWYLWGKRYSIEDYILKMEEFGYHRTADLIKMQLELVYQKADE
jgi:hypothetical protein